MEDGRWKMQDGRRKMDERRWKGEKEGGNEEELGGRRREGGRGKVKTESKRRKPCCGQNDSRSKCRGRIEASQLTLSPVQKPMGG